METGKTFKYLKYAIGEIILVMIGILLALQVNNWNERRKGKIVEQQILVQLIEEYTSNLEQLEGKIHVRKSIIDASIDVLTYIDNPININKDSLIFRLAKLGYDPTFDPIHNDLISSGNIRLIKNSNLRKLLSNWSSDVVSVQEMEQQWQLVRNQINYPFMIKLDIYRDIIDENLKGNHDEQWLLDKSIQSTIAVGKSKKTPSTQFILNDKELESVLSLAINYNNVTNIQSMTLQKRINEILKLLNESLEHD